MDEGYVNVSTRKALFHSEVAETSFFIESAKYLFGLTLFGN